MRVVDAVRRCALLGEGTLLVKIDLKNAYRMVPDYPADRHFLGVQWRGKCYVDTALPFGLRSAPIIFSAVADALLWVMYRRGILSGVHYLDDYLFFGRPGLLEGARNREIALATCHELGVPIAAHKVEGPTTQLVFLGLELDTAEQVLRLPEGKMARITAELEKWERRVSCSRRELQELIGLLQHAATVVPAGRAFLRRLIDLTRGRPHPESRVYLGDAARADLRWRAIFLH